MEEEEQLKSKGDMLKDLAEKIKLDLEQYESIRNNSVSLAILVQVYKELKSTVYSLQSVHFRSKQVNTLKRNNINILKWCVQKIYEVLVFHGIGDSVGDIPQRLLFKHNRGKAKKSKSSIPRKKSKASRVSKKAGKRKKK